MFPMGMAVLDDELYVTEGLNHRVQVFTLDGAPIRSFGEQGTGDGQVNYPPAIALSDEAAYVTDRANERVVVFERRTGAAAAGHRRRRRDVRGRDGRGLRRGRALRDRPRPRAGLRRRRRAAARAARARARRGRRRRPTRGRACTCRSPAPTAACASSRARRERCSARCRCPRGSRAPYLLSADERGLLAADGEAHSRSACSSTRPRRSSPRRCASARSAAPRASSTTRTRRWRARRRARSSSRTSSTTASPRTSARGAFVRAFAGMGSGEGQFMYPVRGAASRSSAAAGLDPSSIPSTRGHTPAPPPRRRLGRGARSRAPAQTGLAVHGDEVLVADGAGRRVEVFALDGTFRREFGNGPSGAREAPRARCRTRWASSSATARTYARPTTGLRLRPGLRRRGSVRPPVGRAGQRAGRLRQPGGHRVARRQRLRRPRPPQRFSRSGALQGEFRSLQARGRDGDRGDRRPRLRVGLGQGRRLRARLHARGRLPRRARAARDTPGRLVQRCAACSPARDGRGLEPWLAAWQWGLSGMDPSVAMPFSSGARG